VTPDELKKRPKDFVIILLGDVMPKKRAAYIILTGNYFALRVLWVIDRRAGLAHGQILFQRLLL